MYNSIQHFAENGIPEIEKNILNFSKNPEDMSEFITGIKEVVISLGLAIIKETFESYDEFLRKSGKRKQKWSIVKRDTKNLITSLGNVQYEKTLFINKETKERSYLLDQILGIESHARLSEDAEALLLEEAVETSYEKAGKNISLREEVSKQSVHEKIKELKFKEEIEKVEKKKVKYLYIDADEAHISLQYKETKGDLKDKKRREKNNCQMSKLVYVYEGIEEKVGRRELKNIHYFSGTYAGVEGNKELWEEVKRYIENTYERDEIEKIYFNSDGGKWMKRGRDEIGTEYVLDEFHLIKYLNKLTHHKKEKQEETIEKLKKLIKGGRKKALEKWLEEEKEKTSDEKLKEKLERKMKYIIENLEGAKVRLKREEGVIGSSTESHVSHVLASRMSSRPMGWCKENIDKMSRLRAYKKNGGSMLELVRFQKEKVEEKVSEEIYGMRELLKSEKSEHRKIGKYFDSMQCSISVQTSMKMAFNENIWRL